MTSKLKGQKGESQMVDIPLQLRSQTADEKPQRRVNRGETVNWVPGIVEVKFQSFTPPGGASGPPINPFDPNPPELTGNTVSDDAPFGSYFYEVHFNGKLVGEGTVDIPRVPP